MANSGSARPAHRNITGFGEFQKVLEPGVPDELLLLHGVSAIYHDRLSNDKTGNI
ncbi:MAG: hypothetical protein NHB32_17190 [Fischerella sp. CENA71]|nr:hypothetical protein [Fischerella sp. CENA71]